MKKIKFEKFFDYVENYDKRVGLRKIYKDYNVVKESNRKKCREAWDLISPILQAAKSNTKTTLEN